MGPYFNFTGIFLALHIFFSSPELKTQVSFSDLLMSFVHLSVNFSYLIFFSRTTRPISIKLVTKHSWVLYKWRAMPFSGGDYYKIVKINFKNILKNHRANCNQRAKTTKGKLALMLIKFMKYGLIWIFRGMSKLCIYTKHLLLMINLDEQQAYTVVQLFVFAENWHFCTPIIVNIFIPQPLDPKLLLYKESS